MVSADEDGVAPRVFAMKLNVMLALVLVDCFCNGFADRLWSSDQMIFSVALCIVPIAIHLFETLLFFMLLWHTFLLRYGLLQELFYEFRGLFFFSLVRFAILLASRIPRLLAAVEKRSPAKYWDDPLNHSMFLWPPCGTMKP